MPSIQPFRAMRYDTSQLTTLAEVVAPPYDVISEEMRRTLHERHPNNFVRLELGYDEPGKDRYSASAELLNTWSEDGTFVEETQPAFYAYEQVFQLPEGVELPLMKTVYHRRALFAAVGLEPLGAGSIFPHERTLNAPKEDRLRLLRATQANLSPVFGILSDASLQLETFLASVSKNRTPLFRFTDDRGETHALWRVDDPEETGRISRVLSKESIVIADGHHRYETAFGYRNELGVPPDHPANFVMMGLVSSESDNLVILPIHRIVREVEPSRIAGLKDALREHFDIRVLPFTPLTETHVRDELLRAVQTASDSAYGLYVGGNEFLEIRPKESFGTTPAERLDVARLHTLVLRRLLGVNTDDPTHQKRVSYTIRADEAVAAVRSGDGQCAVLMKPCSIGEMETVAHGGETMPQKSTYFFPKLPSGFVFRRIRR